MMAQCRLLAMLIATSNQTYHPMEPENLDIESIMEDRFHAVEASIHEISLPELKELEETVFPDVTHPWIEQFRRFVEENHGCAFYHATSTACVA